MKKNIIIKTCNFTSPIIIASSGGTFPKAALKNSAVGFPTISALTLAEYSKPAINAPGPSAKPSGLL